MKNKWYWNNVSGPKHGRRIAVALRSLVQEAKSQRDKVMYIYFKEIHVTSLNWSRFH